MVRLRPANRRKQRSRPDVSNAQHFKSNLRDIYFNLFEVLDIGERILGKGEFQGLDEDTAAYIDPLDRMQVVGSGGITVVDVGQLAYSSMALASEGEPVELIGVRLHILANGGRFDLNSRTASPGPHPEAPSPG